MQESLTLTIRPFLDCFGVAQLLCNFKNLIMKKIVIFIIFFLLFFSCSKDDNLICGKVILIDNEKFVDYPSDPLIISDVLLENDCLQISFGASGCDGQNWVMELVGAADIFYSNPPQRPVRLSLKNNEVCQAAFGKTVSFDLKPSRVSGGEIILNLAGWNSPIRYKY
jgi:hypothetical protein